MKETKKNILISFCIGVGFFIVVFFTARFIGLSDRRYHSSAGPLTWQETFTLIPNILKVSLFLSLFSYYVLWWESKKVEDKLRIKATLKKIKRLPTILNIALLIIFVAALSYIESIKVTDKLGYAVKTFFYYYSYYVVIFILINSFLIFFVKTIKSVRLVTIIIGFLAISLLIVFHDLFIPS